MRLFLTSVLLCGILAVSASAATYRYVPRTVIHNGRYHTIWVKQRYQKVTHHAANLHWNYKTPVNTPVKPRTIINPYVPQNRALKPSVKPLVIINPYCEN